MRPYAPHALGGLARALTLALVVVGAGGCAKRGLGGDGAALVVRAPAEDGDAEVYVDGNYVGQVRALTDGVAGPLLLAPGVHRLEIRKPGRFPVQKTLRVDGDSPAEIVVDAELLEDPEL